MGAEGKDGIMHHDESVTSKLQRLVSSEAYQYQRQRMLGMLDIPSRSVAVCDVGCGEGAFCRDLRGRLPQGSSIVGLDMSPFVLGLAKQQEVTESEPISYILGNAQNLPFPPDTFDIVVFANTLKYLKNEEAEEDALRSQLQVLRSGGQLLVVDSNDCEITYEGVDSTLSQKVVDAYAALQGDPLSGSRIKGLCEKIGLKDIKHERIVLEETAFTPIHAGQAMAQNMRDVLKKSAFYNPQQALVFAEEVDDFYSQIVASANNGKYKWNYIKYAVVGKK